MDSIEKAKRAQQLLDDPVIQEFFESYKRNLYERWINTPDREQRDEIYRLQLTADLFRQHFLSLIASGKIELKREDDSNAEN